MDDNRTMMETAYEDKLLNLGFVLSSVWRQRLGDDLLLMN